MPHLPESWPCRSSKFAIGTLLCKYERLPSSISSVVLANRAARHSAVTFTDFGHYGSEHFWWGGSTAARVQVVFQQGGDGPALHRRFVDTRPVRWVIKIARSTPRAARNDDGALPAPESRRSDPTPAVGSVVALDCLSPTTSGCGSDDNTPAILAGGGTGCAR